MKISVVIGFVLFVISMLSSASDFQKIQLTDFRTNTPVNLSGFDKSKPTYIKMWATWCQPCMEQMPHFQKISEKYKDKINVLAINININEKDQYIEQVIEKFDLTMPILLDNEGQLAVALGLVGTPYSLLINTDNRIVYKTHESDQILDTFIEKLAQGQKLVSENSKGLTVEEKFSIIEPWTTGEHVLFFTATWCDWYLKDSRPKMAADCRNIQSNINALHKQSNHRDWRGFVNHLWTDEKSLSEFIQQYNIDIPFDIDVGGVLFNHFNIRDIPTIIRIDNGKVVEKIIGDDIKNMYVD